jgi:hypothetical protein
MSNDLNIIPMFDFTAFAEDVVLENVQYTFSFTWNSRGSFWTMKVIDRNQNELINSIKLVLNIPLFHDFPDRGLPYGSMVVLDMSGNEAPIGLNDFVNNRCILVYRESV